jgi:mannose-6-phosphate isomerase-like protein (cupin superfamily)
LQALKEYDDRLALGFPDAFRRQRRPHRTPATRDHKRELAMASNPSHPYETRLNILHGPLELIDEKALSDASEYDWYNQTLCRVNDAVVRLGVIKGEYHWHKHNEDDEFFYVVDGQLIIDLEDRSVELSPRQAFVVPKGTVHRTRARQRTTILMVENYGIIPTGN